VDVKFFPFLLRHDVTVEAYLGDSAYGPRYAAPVVVRGLLEQSIRTVRNKDGEEVTSSSTFRAPLDAQIAAEARVTLPDGRTTSVIAAMRHNGAGLPVPDHLEVTLV
jgi:hypothetical protein